MAQIGGMRRQGGGFGFALMLLVLVVIFFLAMNNFKSAAPAAAAIQKHNKDRASREETRPVDAAPESTSASDDTWTPAPPSRPNLSTMDQTTSKHAAAVQDALSQTN
jgi:hypothetical protein